MSQASEESATVYCQFGECERRARAPVDVPADMEMNWDEPMCYKHMRLMPPCACQCDSCWGRYTDLEACLTSVCARDSRILAPSEQAAILRELGNDLCDACHDEDCNTKRVTAINANRIALASLSRADDEEDEDEGSAEGSAEDSAEDSAEGLCESDCETEIAAEGEPDTKCGPARALKRSRSQSSLDSDEERGQAKRRATLAKDGGGGGGGGSDKIE